MVTPTFALPPGSYQEFGIYDSTVTLVDSCLTLAGYLQLVTTVEASIPTGTWNYCAEVLNADPANLGTFNVAWDF